MWESRSVNFGLGQVWIILFFYWSLLLDLIGLNVVQSNTRFENVLVMLKTCTLNNCGMYHMRSRKKWHNALQDECFMKIRKWWRTTIASLDLVLYGPYSKAAKTDLGTTWTVWWYWKKLPWKWTVQIEQKSLTAAFERLKLNGPFWSFEGCSHSKFVCSESWFIDLHTMLLHKNTVLKFLFVYLFDTQFTIITMSKGN